MCTSMLPRTPFIMRGNSTLLPVPSSHKGQGGPAGCVAVKPAELYAANASKATLWQDVHCKVVALELGNHRGGCLVTHPAGQSNCQTCPFQTAIDKAAIPISCLSTSAAARAVVLTHTAALLVQRFRWCTARCSTNSICRVQAYRRVLEHVTTVTGLPESRLLDVRGNHDTFNVPSRCTHVPMIPAVRHAEARTVPSAHPEVHGSCAEATGAALMPTLWCVRLARPATKTLSPAGLLLQYTQIHPAKLAQDPASPRFSSAET